MNTIDRKTVISLIDETGYVDTSKRVAIRFVKTDGSIREMICRKSVKKSGPADKKKTSGTNYHLRNRGMIRVVDEADNQVKDVFIFAIIGCNPKAQTNHFFTVTHGTIS